MNQVVTISHKECQNIRNIYSSYKGLDKAGGLLKTMRLKALKGHSKYAESNINVRHQHNKIRGENGGFYF